MKFEAKNEGQTAAKALRQWNISPPPQSRFVSNVLV